MFSSCVFSRACLCLVFLFVRGRPPLWRDIVTQTNSSKDCLRQNRIIEWNLEFWLVYEARYLARNCELKTRLGDIVSHLRHLSHLSQDKTKLLFSFFLILFNYAIQGKFITWLVNSALNCTWKPISHSSLRDSCDIGFRVQFNAEFPCQLMNFPIVSRGALLR